MAKMLCRPYVCPSSGFGHSDNNRRRQHEYDQAGDAMIASFVIPGPPFGKPRPRHSGHATYRTKPDKQYELKVRAAWRDAGSPTFGAAPVAVVIDAYAPLPVSRPKRIAREPYVLKPDADNIAKAVTDPLNGLAWDDDSQVTHLMVTKHDRARDEEPRVVVTISQIGADTHAH